MNSQKRTGTCNCGAQYEAENRWQRSCPACIELKKAYQAAHPRPIRICEDCGAESRECQRGMCPLCYAAHRAKASAEYEQRKAKMREMRKAKGKQERQSKNPRIEYLHKFSQLSTEDKRKRLLIALKLLVEAWGGEDVEEEEVNPEEVPHDDQDRIDDAFDDLMKGFDQ